MYNKNLIFSVRMHSLQKVQRCNIHVSFGHVDVWMYRITSLQRQINFEALTLSPLATDGIS